MLLLYHLKRAKSFPLSLVLFFNNILDESMIKTVMNMTLKHPLRIKALYLYNPRPHALTILDGEGNVYPQLRILVLKSSSSRMASFRLPNAPALKILFLRGATTSTNLSTTMITHLHLEHVHHNDCIRLLLECSATLIEYMCDSPRVPMAQNSEWWDNDCIYTLPYLEILSWVFDNYHEIWDKIILQRLDLPSLRRLSLSNVSPYHTPVDKPNMFSNIRSTLSTVCITTTFDDELLFDEEGLRRLLNTDRRVLAIDSLSIDILSTLQALTPSRHPERMVPIPSLRMLSLLGYIPPIGTPRDISDEDYGDYTDDVEDCEDYTDEDDENEDDEDDSNSDRPRRRKPSGDEMYSAILQMLEERLLTSVTETTKTIEGPFVLALPFRSTKCPEYIQYEKELSAFIHAGVLQLTIHKRCKRSVGLSCDHDYVWC